VQIIVGLGFVVILFGAKVANFNAGLVCRGFPLCADAGLLPPAAPLGTTHWLHRVLAFAFLACSIALYAQLRRRSDDEAAPVRRTAGWILVLTLIQIAVAAAMVLHLLPPSLRALHLLVGTAVWGALVALAVHSARTPSPEAAAAADPAAAQPSPAVPSRLQPSPQGPGHSQPSPAAPPSLARDFVTLTKPRIISLLLVTTIAPMFITDRGMPPLDLVLWVAIGGYLMAGGANAINMWFDRDIDQVMTRTRTRPIASGRISPAVGLTFGISLGLAAFAILWFMANPLTAWLALSGLLFYVFIYTMWLKRTTPQNIVIGGAAGAFPPLVGWAAVTGGLDLAALYLFAIIFYWTPPHFWALALIKRREYARAGIPMMPVVRSEQRTKVEMLIYSLLLVPLTIMPSVFGALGPFYGVAAALLGGRLIWDAVRVLRERQVGPAAWRMYKYSLLYLALLFVAMGLDRALPFERGPRPADVIILSGPGEDVARHTDGHQSH
jgi:protoheme IX farnesyltransferase